jgi:hypothetical protein
LGPYRLEVSRLRVRLPRWRDRRTGLRLAPTDREVLVVLSKLRSRLTYANVVATLALFVALGGSSYAALTVTGKNVKNSSLTGKDVKNSSLTTSDVKNRSLLAKDFKTGQLPQGVTGPQGTPGKDGRNGATNVVVRRGEATTGGDATGNVFCDPGERAVAGGASRTGGIGGGDTLRGSFPTILQGGVVTPAPSGVTPTGWDSGINASGGGDVVFYVVCASP